MMDKQVIIYDMTAIPSGICVQTLMEMYAATGVVFYDSTKGKSPYTVDKNNLDEDQVVFINVTDNANTN